MRTTDVVIENHTPLLGEKEIEQLERASQGLNLNLPRHQKILVSRVESMGITVTIDGILEYLVRVCDVSIGGVTLAIRQSPDCNAARRIHVGHEQIERHKKDRNGRSSEVKISSEMVGALA